MKWHFKDVVVVLAATAILLFGSHVLTILKAGSENMKLLQGRVEFSQRQIAEDLAEAQTINTSNQKDIQAALAAVEKKNDSLRAELSKLRGQVTSVSTAIGNIHISGGDTLFVGGGDFDTTIVDPWLRSRIARAGPLLAFNYDTTFLLHEMDVEVETPEGLKRHLFDTALVSSVTGDTLHVPVKKTYIEAPKQFRNRFRFEPHPHFLAGYYRQQGIPGIGMNLWTKGTRPYPSGVEWYIVRGDVWMVGKKPAVGVSPVAYNIGQPLPWIENLSLSAGWIWEAQRSGLSVALGVTF